jgi:predicted dehydrogenase/threonine dehydrogenase-like Zn-dependent dehydrogenase
MKQVSQNYKTGSIRLSTVPAPTLRSGGVLIRTHFSVISAGTEGMKVREGKMSYLEKAKARPDQVKKVLQTVQQQGVAAAYGKVMNKLDSLTPLGYSLSGVVTAAGEEAAEFVAGDRVACAGVGYANHAEINFVPRNLVVPVPESVRMEHAAFATLGAIALQGLRQSEMQLGETACVIGLGLIGQILVQLLRAAGMHVVGVDLVPQRCEIACASGVDTAGAPDSAGVTVAIERLTRGAGADCIFLCAGGDSNKPVELAVALARDRARVVDIGKTRLDLPWKDFYEKELDVRFSRSYGPGRYDPNYEERGIDYPIGYVRWTERRNMEAFLDQIARGEVDLDPIISSIEPFEDAERVYQDLSEGKAGGLGIVFRHPTTGKEPGSSGTTAPTNASSTPVDGEVRVGVIGAGNYARSMLLPHLVSDSDARLVEVSTATSLSAEDAARKFGFERKGTSYRELLSRDDISAVLIATRHASHAEICAAALRSGKAVFVEKPLAIDLAGVEAVRSAVSESDNDRLLVGFNRRYAPTLVEIKNRLAGRTFPLTMMFRVHAGQMESSSWYLDPTQGTRFIGEAGHFLDVFSFLTDARPTVAYAISLRPESSTPDDLENVSCTIRYDDGSAATLQYLTQGGSKTPKEMLEVLGGGQTMQLQNFNAVQVYTNRGKERIRKGGADKGQANQVRAFVRAVKSGSAMPISVDCLLDTTLVTLACAESMRRGAPVEIAEFWNAES